MIIVADRILTGDRSMVLKDAAVCIKDGVIQKIGKKDELEAAFPQEAVVSYPGCTLLPGLIDLHTHIGLAINYDYEGKYNSPALCALFAAGRMRETLKKGVLTIRDSSSANGIGTALKQAAADGHILAPRIFASLQGITITGGHGADAINGGVIEADGALEVKKAVRLNIKRGADCIKVLTSEGYRGEELDQEELNAAVAEAHRFGRKVAAHAGYGRSLDMCIEAGVDSIEHGTNLTVEQAKRMKERDITLVPTVMVFNYVYNESMKNISALGSLKGKPAVLQYLEEAVAAYQKNLRSLYDTGVRMATGTDTDCTNYPGASPVADECAYMVSCGLKPLEAVECATKNGADYLGLGDTLGQVKEGYTADLIVVGGDPSSDIAALKDIKAVYQSGKDIFSGAVKYREQKQET